MIGELIRIERLKKGWSQENMAFMLDISQPAYSKIESGQTTMTLPRLYEIAKFLEIDVNELIKGGQLSMSTDLSILQKWGLDLKVFIRKWRLRKNTP
ncbi:MAG: helix-turn-helix transcriptional regulator [Pelobium sp.]